jgi:hydrogenase large subunit
MINGERHHMDENKIYEDMYLNWHEEVGDDSYSFVKTARYDGIAMEVGPLARLQLTGEYSRGNSVMDRLKARVLECHKIAAIMQRLLFMMEFHPGVQEKYEIPESAYGIALKDTTGGALGHWVYVENKRIRGYEIMTPSSWNLSPESSTGEKGILEKALIGTNIENEQFPVEIGRIIRSFDPCISCATHVITSRDNWETQII